jgi:periplasmic divalent cation tolerance protein
MKPATRFALVMVTAPDLKTARLLARTALRARLAACVNLIPRLESHYWWQGKLERGAEVLLLFKTSQRKLASLEKSILANHPYDTPEFLVLSLANGNEGYLAWLAQSIQR